MVDETLKNRMHTALDGELDESLRRQMTAQIDSDPEAARLWAMLQEAEHVLSEAPELLPVLEPRRGFSTRFNARLTQRRRERPSWLGALALGLGALVPLLAVFGSGAAFLAPLASAFGQPTASLALQTSAEISLRVVSGLLAAAMTVARVALASPVVWAGLLLGLAATCAWLIWMGRLVLSTTRRPV